MSNGIHEKNNKYINNYEDFRFRDAAQAIFFKYQMMDIIKPSDGTTITTNINTSVHVIRDRQETTVRSRACIIL
ncbi:unnamed protein product [Rotaria sordida]|uniref:Uncharacterized protein n=1 Tax=Rotaria sordida TaxID=392033 RepID=A0A813ZEG0_9BILA|nr:unnamed protein product [Rotaria sordida]CAF0886391.1 unnamed protein product [Rotaria sordida]CAF0898320.1 unnamed protein product [Rotaria sordida]CAF3524003.1 unnamed protein product [Rotaria sordida]